MLFLSHELFPHAILHLQEVHAPPGMTDSFQNADQPLVERHVKFALDLDLLLSMLAMLAGCSGWLDAVQVADKLHCTRDTTSHCKNAALPALLMPWAWAVGAGNSTAAEVVKCVFDSKRFQEDSTFLFRWQTVGCRLIQF